MTKQRASELWPVLQAWASNVPIQVKIGSGHWQVYTGTCPDFNNENWRWQVAPIPREYWLQGNSIFHDPACRFGAGVIIIDGPILVREVLL